MTTHKGLFALIACAFVFGTFGIFVKFLDKTFGPYEQVLLRNIVAALISLISAFICHTPITYKGISPKMLFLYASTWVPIVITFTLAVQYIKVSAAVSIFYAANLCTAYFIGSRLFHEKITLYAWIGILVSFVGLAWYAYPFHITSQSSIGYMLIFASGCLDAISSALNKHLSLQLNRESAALIRSLFGILVAGVFVLMNNDTITYTDFTNTNIIILILFGGMLFLINSLVMYGFREMEQDQAESRIVLGNMLHRAKNALTNPVE
jgi:drug/metabolite transporter (DMT)-like permease